MLQLDDSFLQSVGISELPEEQKKDLLQKIYEELEVRVGEMLAQGLSDAQLKEFEAILDHDKDALDQWLADNIPDYTSQEDFKSFIAGSGFEGEEVPPETLSGYVSMKWLELNRPDYKQVVASVLEEMKQELIKNRDAILAQQDQSGSSES